MVLILHVVANLSVLGDFTILLSNLRLLYCIQIFCLSLIHSINLLHQFHLTDGLFGKMSNLSTCFFSCCLGF